MRLRLTVFLVSTLIAFISVAKPVQNQLFVTNIQMSYKIDTALWKWERKFSLNDRFHASAFYRNEEDSKKSIRIGISKVAKFPDEEKPRALRGQEEIPKLLAPDGGGIGNCSFGDLEGYVQQGKDDFGDYTHVILMEPAFGGIVFLFARNVPMEDLEVILQTFETKLHR